MPESPTPSEARLQALHALWELTIRAAIHGGLHAEDAAAVVETLKARIEALRSAGDDV